MIGSPFMPPTTYNNNFPNAENRASKPIAIRTLTGITCSPSTSQLHHHHQPPMSLVASQQSIVIGDTYADNTVVVASRVQYAGAKLSARENVAMPQRIGNASKTDQNAISANVVDSRLRFIHLCEGLDTELAIERHTGGSFAWTQIGRYEARHTESEWQLFR